MLILFVIAVSVIQINFIGYGKFLILHEGMDFFSAQLVSPIVFIILSLALIFLHLKLQRIACGISIIGFLISSCILLVTFFDIHFIDLIKYHQFIMSGNAILCFLSLFFIVASFQFIKKYKILFLINYLLLMAVFFITITILICNFMGLPWVYDLDIVNNTSITISTLLLMLALVELNLLVNIKQRYRLKFGYLPHIIFTIFFILFLLSWCFVLFKNYGNINRAKTQVEEMLTSQANTLVDTQIIALQQMVEHWGAEGKIIKFMWHHDAKAVVRDSKLIDCLILIKPNGKVYLSEPNSIIFDKAILAKMIHASRLEKKLVISSPQIRNNGKSALYILLPIYFNHNLSGFLLATTNITNFMNVAISPIVKANYNIYVYKGDDIIYENFIDTLPGLEHRQSKAFLTKNNLHLSVKIIPSYKFKHTHMSDLPSAILIFGLLLSLTLAMLAYFLQQTQALSRKNQLILDTVGEGIFGLDTRGLVSFINPAAAQLLGYKESELVGKPPIFLDSFAVDDKQHYEGSGTLTKKSGKTFPVYCASRAMYTKQGAMNGIVIAFSDLSILLERQATLARRTKQLEASNKELESFSYSVSHDLLAPLRHITAFIELLEEDMDNQLTEESKENFQIIKESAKKMAQLIDELLTFSRAGRLKLKREYVCTNVLMDEVVEEFGNEIKSRNIEIKYNDLPRVYADKIMLKQVFQNLLSNALKFTVKKDKVLIKIECQEENDCSQFTFVDNGIGFDNQYADKLFGVFQRLHKETEYPGTGIGLANVARIIARHGGDVWAKGIIDKGASIFFTIPKITEESQ